MAKNCIQCNSSVKTFENCSSILTALTMFNSSGQYVDSLSQKPFGWDFIEMGKDPATLTHFKFEEIDMLYWKKFIEDRPSWAVILPAIYFCVIFGLQKFMKNRAPFDLKQPLFWWNAILSVFSIFTFARTLPGFLNVLFNENGGFYVSLCHKQGLDIPTTYWTILFGFSKIWEFGDTIFIVLRKRPLQFLHWYHHMVTMGASWLLAPYVEPLLRWYVVINSGVHSLMYPYFAMKAVGMKVPVGFINLITTVQFVQMIVDVAVNLISLTFQKLGYDCVRYPLSVQVFLLVHGSFVFLFGKLFYDSVILKGRVSREKKNKQKMID